MEARGGARRYVSARRGSGSSICRIPLTTLTMIAARTPHQNVWISNWGTTQSVT